MGSAELQKKLEEKEITNKITRANTAIEELELKILQAQVRIENMTDHIALQRKVIQEAQNELKAFKGEKAKE